MPKHLTRAGTLLLLLAVAAPARAGTAAATPERELVNPPGEVVLGGSRLFEIRGGIGPLSPQQRAEAIQRRLRMLARHPTQAAGSLRTEPRGQNFDLLAGDTFVLSVTDDDAALTGIPKEQLASLVLGAVRDALLREAEARTSRALARGAGLAGLATIVLILFVLGTLWLQRRGRGWVTTWTERRRDALKVQGAELVSSGQLRTYLLRALRLSWIVVVVLAVVAWLEFVLRQFPWTRDEARAALAFVLDALGKVAGALVGYLPNLVYIAIFVLIARLVVKVAGFGFRELGRGSIKISGFHPEWADPTFKIARFLIVVFAAVAVFPYLPGSGSPAFQAISLFVGVLFSLGSTSSVANIVAGLVLTYMQSFRLGDRIRCGDAEGMITELNLLVVRLRTDKNVEVTLPSATILAGAILNYSAQARQQGLILHTSVTIGYATPWRQVHGLLLEAARGTEDVLSDPAPFVLQSQLDDFYVKYELNAYTANAVQLPLMYSRLHQAIQDAFFRAGVEIMSPHYTALRDGNEVAVPPENRPAGYRTPPFQVARVESPSSVAGPDDGPRRNVALPPVRPG